MLLFPVAQRETGVMNESHHKSAITMFLHNKHSVHNITVQTLDITHTHTHSTVSERMPLFTLYHTFVIISIQFISFHFYSAFQNGYQFNDINFNLSPLSKSEVMDGGEEKDSERNHTQKGSRLYLGRYHPDY